MGSVLSSEYINQISIVSYSLVEKTITEQTKVKEKKLLDIMEQRTEGDHL